jgi:thymidylate synthase (FAD)
MMPSHTDINKAHLVCISSPREPGLQTAEDVITYCARISNPSNQKNLETSPRLLDYLIRHGHWSPFETVSMTLGITTTRDIARQMLRHRSFSFQEFSQRYAQVSEFAHREPRLQDKKNRQNSIETASEKLHEEWEHAENWVQQVAKDNYYWALEEGIAKEQARALLPEGLTVSTMYMAGTIRSWMHYIDLRAGPETQKEHRQVALSCKEIMIGEFPIVSEAMGWIESSP